MTLEELEKRIIEIYYDENNFVITLRLDWSFDEKQYTKVVDLYEQYIDALGSSPTVNRQVARFIVDCDAFLLNTLAEMRQGNAESDLIQKVSNAHAKLLDLLTQLLI
ncbi:MAG: hypothetical protein KC708_17270 [Anaerolineae bacterium]|nr:hypothetical protein [Anaerolineae bacterium]